jgi:RNA polymerase sigma-70 factor (ECF subfamily)
LIPGSHPLRIEAVTCVRGSDQESKAESTGSPAANSTPDEPLQHELALLYKQHAAGLFRYAIWRTRDSGYAQDAVQEVFLRYFIARSEGQRVANITAWLFRVLRNHVIDGMRAADVRAEVDIDSIREPADRRQDFEAQFHNREVLRRLSAALAPRELECMRLRAEGLRYEEIAQVLSVRSGTVGALLARADCKIRKYFQRTMPKLKPSEAVETPYAP